MTQMNFLTVTRGKDLESLQGSGLIGLSPTPGENDELASPLQNGIPSFIAQLKQNSDYNHNFDQMFSVYLSNDNVNKVPGDISFGGYDLEKYAKKGAQIQWMDQSHNEFYWTVSSKNVNQGGKPISQNNQQIIFDNGMSLAMVPEKAFVEVVKRLHDHGLECREARPVW